MWPLVDIHGFMEVTGVWLVKTVGALLIPVAVCMFLHLLIDTDHRLVIALGSLTALAFIGIDFTMHLTTSSPISTWWMVLLKYFF